MWSEVVVGDHSTFLHPTYHEMKEQRGFHILTIELTIWSHCKLMQPLGQMGLELDGISMFHDIAAKIFPLF
jgi:hypothetical protein